MSLPPRVTDGPERALLENMLDRNRAALIDTVRGLSDAEAHRRLVPSLTTPIGLLKHAAFAERLWFQRQLAGLSEADCDGYAVPGDGSWLVAAEETLAEVIGEFERASERSRRIASDHDLDQATHHPELGGTVSLRWIYLHMIEEFARHAGHGDILREQLAAAPVR